MRKILITLLWISFAPLSDNVSGNIAVACSSSLSSVSSYVEEKVLNVMPIEEYEKVIENIKQEWFTWNFEEGEESVVISIGWNDYKVDRLKILNIKTRLQHDTVEDCYEIIMRTKEKVEVGEESES